MTGAHLPLCAPRHPRGRLAINVLLLLASVSLLTGLFAPLLSFHKLVLYSNSVSLVSGLAELARRGEWILLVASGGFSVLLPVVQLVLLHRIWNAGVCPARTAGWLHRRATYGKWSMLEVFVVAVLLVAVKLGTLGRVEGHLGLYAFALSVLLTMIVTARLSHLAAPSPRGGVHG